MSSMEIRVHTPTSEACHAQAPAAAAKAAPAAAAASSRWMHAVWLALACAGVLALGLGLGLGLPASTGSAPAAVPQVTLTLSLVDRALTFNGVSYPTRTMAYSDGTGSAAWMAPTLSLHVVPGHEARAMVTVSNQLPPDAAFPTNPGSCVTVGAAEVQANVNNMHLFHVTNIHMHGFAVPPQVDSPSIQIGPGQNHTYDYRLNAFPSSFGLYHPHKHGAALVQVSNGLVGAALLRVAGGLEDTLQQEVEILVAVGELGLVNSTVNTTVTGAPLATPEYRLLNDPLSFACDSEGGYETSTFRAILVNGAPVAVGLQSSGITSIFERGDLELPEHSVRPGGLAWLRVLNARPNNFLVVALQGADSGFMATLQPVLVSVDGYLLPTPQPFTPGLPGVPHFNNAPGLVVGNGGRIEVVVPIPLDAPLGANFTVVSLEGYTGLNTYQPNATGGGPWPGVVLELARVVVRGERYASAASVPASLPADPSLHEERSLTDKFVSERRHFRLAADAPGVPTDPAYAPNGPSHILASYFFDAPANASGMLYNSTLIVAEIQLNSVEEWTLDNTSPSAHPFHLHIVPYYLVSLSPLTTPTNLTAYTTGIETGPSVLAVPRRYFTDVLLIPAGYRAVIRIDWDDYNNGGGGVSPIHCHIIFHEDNGMMANIRVGPMDRHDPFYTGQHRE